MRSRPISTAGPVRIRSAWMHATGACAYRRRSRESTGCFVPTEIDRGINGSKVLDGFLPDGSGLATKSGAGKKITVDFNGYTYTMVDPAVGSTGTATQALHFEYAEVTLKNGTFVVAENAENVKMAMQNYTALTIESMTMDFTNVSLRYYPDYTGTSYAKYSNLEIPIFNNNSGSTAVIKDSTLTFNSASKFGVHVESNVTMIDSTVNGSVSLSTDDCNGSVTLENTEATKGIVVYFEGNVISQNGNTYTAYATLEQAVQNSASGATVRLTADIDYSATYTERNARDYGREHIVDLKDLTLDMSGKTINTINATVVFAGNGATIENGTFDLVEKNTDGSYKDGSYALFIDNGVASYGKDGTVSVKNVTVDGGINVSCATVTLENVTAHTTTTKFYAIWAEQNATVTVNGGTYTDNQASGKGVIATGKGAEGGAKVYVNGGTFEGANKLVYSSETGSVVISGGEFNGFNPENYLAEGYTATEENGVYTVEKQ